MMRLVILVSGASGQGKSWLAEKLLSDYAFRVLSVDACYVEFIETQVPTLFFPAMKKYVKIHYDNILSSMYSKNKFGRDFVKEWREYLLGRILIKLRSGAAQLVVEGYLLYDCSDFLKQHLSKKIIIREIAVKKRKYRFKTGKNVLSVKQIAALGF